MAIRSGYRSYTSKIAKLQPVRKCSMSSKKVFTVLGAGNGGMATAADIAAQGYAVRLFEGLPPTDDFKRLAEEKEIHINGDGPTSGRLELVTGSMQKAVEGADVILLVAPAFAHRPLFERLIPHLIDGMDVVLVPGNFGSFLLRKMMREQSLNPRITISEVASLPYACRITDYHTVTVFKRKQSLKLGTWPVEKNRKVLETLSGYTAIYKEAQNVLEIALDNFNCILHPLPVLLNYGAIDQNPAQFRHYMDGISPLVSQQMKKMDQERINIGRAYGLNLVSTLDQLKTYYGINTSTSIFKYVNSPQTPYADLIGHSTHGRYLTEDLPYLLCPIYQLGEKARVKTKLFKLTIDLASQLHGRDYLAEGNNIEKLGLTNMSVDELLTYTRQGTE